MKDLSGQKLQVGDWILKNKSRGKYRSKNVIDIVRIVSFGGSEYTYIEFFEHWSNKFLASKDKKNLKTQNFVILTEQEVPIKYKKAFEKKWKISSYSARH